MADDLTDCCKALTVAIPGILVSCIKRKPFVFEVRDLWPEIPVAMGILNSRILIVIATLLERIAYRHANHIIALSEGMAEGVEYRVSAEAFNADTQ